MSKLDKIFKSSKKMKIDNDSKIVIMSDCHRGSGDNYDNFLKNQNIYEAALKHYFRQEFTYIELGDGDEMWEVDNYKDIVNEHLSTFKLLKKFNDDNRLIMIFGNHDMCKKSKKILENTFYTYTDKETNKEKNLLNNLVVYESLTLNYNNHDIFLVHGHQVDLMSGTFFRLSKFLVRHVYRPLEHIAIKDPTSAAKNYKVSKKVEKKLENWSNVNNKILIAGHTHRPLFPKTGQSLYFNDGSCIHPNGISCLEIEKGKITLVKWEFSLIGEKYIYARRVVLEGSELISNFFKNNLNE